MTQQPQLQMLDNMYQEILDTGIYSPDIAFYTLLEYIANKVDFEDSVPSPWLKSETYLRLGTLFDIDLLRKDQWDWIGELHSLRGLSLINGDYEDKRETVEGYVGELKRLSPKNRKIERFLNPVSSTGRSVLVLAKHFPETVYYLADDDLLAYRIALLNMKIYNVRAVVLRANAEKHDLREFSPNWRYANRWTPIKHTKMFSEEETDSRKEVTEEGTYRFV